MSDCKHEWLRLCKVPGQGICLWCDHCKVCGIKRIDEVAK